MLFRPAGCFGSRPLPRNGCLIEFGGFTIYVATKIVRGYPDKVHIAADPPAVCAARGRHIARPASCVEVMMTSPVFAARGVVAEAEASTKSARTARPPLVKPENRTTHAGTPAVPVVPSSLQDVIEKLATPVAPSADAALAQAELDEQRRTYSRRL